VFAPDLQISRLDVRALLDEVLGHGESIVEGQDVQGAPAVGIFGIDVRSVSYQHLDHFVVSLQGCQPESCLSVVRPLIYRSVVLI
jgi:hypothetical protein